MRVRILLGTACLLATLAPAFGQVLDSESMATMSDAELIAAYPTLDAAGQYEVLLLALERNEAAYAPLFEDIVRAMAQTQRVDRRELVAAVFALQVYDAELASALAEVDTAVLQTQLQPRTSLDGFPYSDVVRRSVADPLDLVREAQDFSIAYGQLLARGMTEPEAAQLQTYRERMDTVQRLPFGAQPGSLAATLQRMSAQYDWLNFSDIFRTLRFSELKLALPEAPRAYTEVMAAICNREDVAFYSNPLVPFSWTVGPEGATSGYVQTPRCTASGGCLFTLRGYVRPAFNDNGATLSLMVNVSGPIGWLNSMTDFHFEFDSIETEGGSLPLATMRALPGTPLVNIELGDGTPDQLGALTLRGTATLHVPTSLRVIEADVAGRASLQLTEGPLQLNYATSLEEARYDWGVTPLKCCDWPGFARRLPLSIGMVQLFDTSGILRQNVASGGVSYELRNATSFRFLDMSNASTFQPGKLVWTFAPSVEEVRVPVVFEGVRFSPAPPPQEQ